ncbi:hypothetical protein ES703_22533 [subsurface metagenome]
MLAVTTAQIGSSGASIALAWSDAIKEKTGMSIRIVPSGGDPAKMMPLVSGEADMTLVTAATGFCVSHGLDYFGREEWGPQPLRVVWQGRVNLGLMTRADANIRTLADLKGKRCARLPASATMEAVYAGIFAFAGITWDDVTPVIVPGYGAGWRGVIEGTIDFFTSSFSSALAFELEAKRGVFWVPLPAADKEGWERYRKYCPWFSPTLVTRGAGVSPDKPVEAMVYPYPVYALPTLDPDIAYAVTKALWESHEMYEEKFPDLPFWTNEVHSKYQRLSQPYHEGTVRLMKEKGVWTAEMEAWQKAQIAKQEGRAKAWVEAKAAAAKEKISLTKAEWWGFYQFWHTWLIDHDLVSYPTE